MSDQNGIHTNGEPKPVAQVVITLLDNGNVVLNTTKADKVWVYGLLEVAKEGVAKGFAPHKPEIIPIRGALR